MHIASAATSLKFHDFPSGAVVYNYQPGTRIDGPIRSISWSKDGNWLTLVPHSGLTEIVSIKKQLLNPMHTIQCITEPSCAAFHNGTKKYVAVGTKNGQVLLYDIKSRSVAKRFPRTTSEITCIEFTAKDNHIIASTKSGNVLLYSNITNSLSGTFKVPKSESVSALRTNPSKRNLVVAGSNEGIVVVWDTSSNKTKFFCEAHSAPAASVTFSPVNADLVLTTGLDRQCCFFDIETKDKIAVIPVDNNVTSADFSRDGINIVLGSQNGMVYIYDSRRIQEPIQQLKTHNSSVKHLLFQKSDDGDNSINSIKSNVVLHNNETESFTTPDTSENFGLYVEVSNSSNQGKTSIASKNQDANDSFMAALGLDLDNSIDSARYEMDNKISSFSKHLSRSQPVLNDTPCIPTSIQLTSKLSFSREKLASVTAASSPKMTQKKQTAQSRVNIEELKTATAETIQTEMSELREEISKMSNNVDFQLRSFVSQMRRMSLDMQMAMVKEFIKFENEFNGLREDMRSEGVGMEVPQSDHLLIEENMRLKKKVVELEQQIANVVMSQQNAFSELGKTERI